MKLLIEQWRQYLIEGDSKMDAIDIEKAKESSSEEWRKHLNEMISTRELEDFDAKYKNPENVQILASELLDLGWAREAVEHHKTEIPPFSEIRNPTMLIKLSNLFFA